jgi:rhodanese-related sulfurtransferase
MEPEVSPAQAAETGTTLVDVRTSEEWAEGHLPGAIHIPLPELQERAAEISDGPVVFYCRTGDRSSMAAEAFRVSGRDAASLAGGLEAWQADGRPLDT